MSGDVVRDVKESDVCCREDIFGEGENILEAGSRDDMRLI